MVLQRFPNKASLAMAVHKELGSSQGKKKMSRLKRIILRERADKAAVQAASAADLAAANLVKSKSALDCLQKQLKVTDKPFVRCAHSFLAWMFGMPVSAMLAPLSVAHPAEGLCMSDTWHVR